MSTTMKTAALVLAAGRGTRMGGPKVLLEVDGVALVQRHVVRFAELGCAPVVVVTRPELRAAVRALVGPDVTIAAATTRSQSESLAVGAPLVEGVDAVFITPVDLVAPRRDTLQRLLESLDDRYDAVTPQHDGRGGHPVLLRCAQLESVRGTLREHLATIRRLRVKVSDPAVLVDLDRPEDLKQR